MTKDLDRLRDVARTLLDQVKYLAPEKFDGPDHEKNFNDILLEAERVIDGVSAPVTGMPPMTSEEYVADRGTLCPLCRSDDIRGGRLDISGTEAWQPVDCMTCRSTWNDLFNLVGYGELTPGGIDV